MAGHWESAERVPVPFPMCAAAGWRSVRTPVPAWLLRVLRTVQPPAWAGAHLRRHPAQVLLRVPALCRPQGEFVQRVSLAPAFGNFSFPKTGSILCGIQEKCCPLFSEKAWCFFKLSLRWRLKSGRFLGFLFGVRRLDLRQTHFKFRVDMLLAADADLCVVQVDDLFGDIQSQPQSGLVLTA